MRFKLSLKLLATRFDLQSTGNSTLWVGSGFRSRPNALISRTVCHEVRVSCVGCACLPLDCVFPAGLPFWPRRFWFAAFPSNLQQGTRNEQRAQSLDGRTMQPQVGRLTLELLSNGLRYFRPPEIPRSVNVSSALASEIQTGG